MSYYWRVNQKKQNQNQGSSKPLKRNKNWWKKPCVPLSWALRFLSTCLCGPSQPQGLFRTECICPIVRNFVLDANTDFSSFFFFFFHFYKKYYNLKLWFFLSINKCYLLNIIFLLIEKNRSHSIFLILSRY